MKKILVLFLALSVFGGAAFAQQDLGMTAGVEFNIGALNVDGLDATDSPGTFVRPFFIWENSDLVEGLELEVEIGIPFWTNGFGSSDMAIIMGSEIGLSDELWLDLDLRLFAGFSLPVTPEGTLRFSAEFENWFEVVRDWDAFHHGIVTPAIRYTHDLGDMSFFGQAAFPSLLFAAGDDIDISPFDIVGFDFTVGMNMGLDAGLLGFELTLENIIRDELFDMDFVQHLSLLPNFTFADLPLYVEAEIRIPLYEDGMDWEGLSIIPEVRYNVMDNLQVFFNLPISGIASEFDVILGLGVGVQFSF
jgi:hypothetical protein